MKKRKIAVLAPDLSILNGVTVVAKFLHDQINSSEAFAAELISLATSSADEQSVRLAKPKTWRRGVQVETKRLNDFSFRHIGSNFTEIEFFRYRPRPILDEILRPFDLIQIVTGVPVWTLAAKNFAGKIALQVATLTAVERASVLAETAQPKRAWLSAMTKINEKLEREAFQIADVIFVENNWLKKHLETNFAEKTIFAPPGVDTKFFEPSVYRENGYLLSVGRFGDRRKNAQMLFRAYKSAAEKLGGKIPKLILAGQTAPSDSDLREAELLGIRQDVEILTDVSSEKLRELYQNASLFALSSNEEGFGLVIAEAMACGLPVVATRCGGPEVLIEENENGYLIPVNDSEKMAEKICHLLESPERRRQFGVKAREICARKFSAEATAKIYLETYGKLLNERQ